MANDKSDHADAISFAGGVVAVALMEHMIERRIINRDDAAELLITAQKRCLDAGATDAALIMSALYVKAKDSA